MNETAIRAQYQEHEKQFEQIKGELLSSLENIASIFYQRTRFKVAIPQPRLKPITSVLTKMRKKHIDSDSLFVKEDDRLSLAVNDFLGARIVCNTREDVREIKELLSQSRRFRLIKEQEHNKPSGYRALHLDMLYEVHWKDDLLFIPIEIQLKTHLQNAWADITHDESYKPEEEELRNELETEYSRQMADILDTLDSMASTIRKQRLSAVKPPPELEDSDQIINSKTLSFKIDSIKKGERLTQQEMNLAIVRLRDQGFDTIAEAWELLEDPKIEGQIKEAKEKLRDDKNVTAFEMLYYGSLLKRGSDAQLLEEMSVDYGFVQLNCLECGRLLSTKEHDFIKEKTDSDRDYYCEDHCISHFPYQCEKCGTHSSTTMCKNCAAEVVPF
jgi:ppGpp synthetase/RelA/SpoT-type nucleotidyltranferase